MTISQTQLVQALSEPVIDEFLLGYFQEKFREEIQQQLIELYEVCKSNSGYSRADFAKKIGRRPEQVTRWLSAPSNLEADTISDMSLGLGVIPKLVLEPINSLFAQQQSIPNQGNSTTDYVTVFTHPANENYHAFDAASSSIR